MSAEATLQKRCHLRTRSCSASARTRAPPCHKEPFLAAACDGVWVSQRHQLMLSCFPLQPVRAHGDLSDYTGDQRVHLSYQFCTHVVSAAPLLCPKRRLSDASALSALQLFYTLL